MNNILRFLIILTLSFLTSCNKSENNDHAKQLDEKEIRKKLIVIANDQTTDYKKKEKLYYSLKDASEKIGYDLGVLQSGHAIMTVLLNQSRYKEGLEMGETLKKIAANKKDTIGLISNIYRKSGLALGYLGLNDESIKDFKKATKYAEQIIKKDTRFYTLSLCYQNQNIYYINKNLEGKKYRDTILNNLNKSNEMIQKVSDDSKTISLKYGVIAHNYIRLGIFYLEEPEVYGNLEKAENNLLKGFKIQENPNYKVPPTDKIMMLNQLSWLYLEKKDHVKCVDYAKRALTLEKRYRDPYHRVESYEFLSGAYVALGEKKNAEDYLRKFSNLKDSIRFAERNSADVLSTNIISNAEAKHETITNRQMIVIFIISFLLLKSIFFLVLWRKRNKLLKKNYESVIENIKNNSLKERLIGIDENEGLPQAKIIISDETEKMILLKLEEFEKSDQFLKKDITISFLSEQFNTNTKYLSEIIKNQKKQNFNTYINSLRISYIISKLYNDPAYRGYKISYLAEVCGFASYQVFNLAFKKTVGITPLYFIMQLQDDSKSMQNDGVIKQQKII